MQSEIELCRELFPQLLEIALTDFNDPNLKSEIKGDSTPVTQTDLKLDKLIHNAISKRFPIDHILSEEKEGNLKHIGRMWIIDPICGTGNFGTGVLFFTTNISLVIDGKPAFAFSVDYPNKTYFWASQDQPGVYIKDKRQGNKFILDAHRVPSVDPGYVPFTGTKDERSGLANIYKEFLNLNYWVSSLGSSLTFPYAAIGRYGLQLVTKAYPWDIVSGAFMMEQNGGVVTNLDGTLWDITSTSVLGSLDHDLHFKALEIVKRNWQNNI